MCVYEKIYLARAMPLTDANIFFPTGQFQLPRIFFFCSHTYVCAPLFLEGLYTTGAFLAQEQITLESPRKKNQTELEDKMTGNKYIIAFLLC